MPGRPAAGDTPVGICLWRLEPDHSTPFDKESTVVLDHPIALLAILVPSATGRLALALLTTLAGRPAFAQLPFMVEARVPKAPTVVTGSTGSFLVYEILVTNFEVGEIRWTGLEVTDGTGAPLLTLADSALWDNMTRPLQGRVPFLERPRLNTMQQAVLFLQVPVNGAAPMELRHRLTFADTAGTRTLSMRPVPVVVIQVIGEGSPQLQGIENNHVIQAFAPDRTDHSLRNWILPWRPRSNHLLGDPQILDAAGKLAAINTVAVPE